MRKFLVILSLVVLPLLSGMDSPPVFCSESVVYENSIHEGLNVPLDAVVSQQGNIYILESDHKVVEYDDSGNKISEFSFGENSGEQIISAGALTLSSGGRLILTEKDLDQIKIFNLSGEALLNFGSSGNNSGQFKGIGGVATDDYGFVYAADRENHRIQIFTPNGLFMKSIPTSAEVLDVAVDHEGVIFALVPESGTIEKFSRDGRKIGLVSCKTAKEDLIQKSTRLKIDPWGHLYLIQPGEERIVKIDTSGNLLLTFGSEGNAKGQFTGISGLALDDKGRVMVADSGNGRLQIFKVSGTMKSVLSKGPAPFLILDYNSTLDAQEGTADIFFLSGKGLYSVSDIRNAIGISQPLFSSFGSEGAGPGQMSSPKAIFVTNDKRIFVADSGNNRIEIFDNDGTLNYEFGRSGKKYGQFDSPQGIAVNGKGMIFVADTMNNRVQVFNHDGIFLNVLGSGSGNLQDPQAQSCGDFNMPRSLAVDSRDRLYVVDGEGTRIKQFDENGNCLKTIGEPSPATFVKIADISVDQNDNLYVADAGAFQVKMFDRTGKFILSFGSSGHGGGYFKQISSVAAADGKVYVADYQNAKVQVFDYVPDGILGKTDRLNTTKSSPPADAPDHNIVQRYAMARQTAFDSGVKEFTDSLGFSRDYLLRFVRTESVEILNDGQIKVTISIPKFIPREIKPVEVSVSKSGGQS